MPVHKSSTEAGQIINDRAGKARKPYRKPGLKSLGDLRTLTLGGSPGTGDSGGAGGYSKPYHSAPISPSDDSSPRSTDASPRQ
jgi:hypothetical protein